MTSHTYPWRFSLYACLLVSLMGVQALAADLPEPVTTVEGITEYRLDNGLKVLLFPDPSKATVTVNVTYLVGSRHEGRGEAGMAHLLEHMVFKGTPTYENIWGALEDHGARFNGTTWVDRTNYFETLPASDENLEFALHMESDRMINSKISAEELAKEMTVVRNEFEMGENSPSNNLDERMMSAAYLWHNYGKSTIGNRSDIERVPAESLQRFYKRYYQPDNAMLVVAGKFEPEDALERIVKHFGTIPKPTRVLDATYTEEPVQDGPRFVTVKRVGDVALAGVLYHVPAGAHPDFPAIQVLQQVLTSQPAGRLYKTLVEDGKASSVRGYAFAWAEPGVMMSMAEFQTDIDPQAVLDEMTETIEGLAEGGISEEEVERIKTRLLKNIKLALTDSGKIGIELSEFAALGDWRMFFLNRDNLKKVTAEDVMRAAGAYLKESNRTAGLFIPTKELERSVIPPTPDVAKLVEGYKGSEEIAAGEVFAATPENIDKRTRRFDLSEGVRVAMLSKSTRGKAVKASIRLHFGTEKTLQGKREALVLIPTLLMRGTKERDYQALRDEIDRLQSRIMLGGGIGNASLRIESDRDNIVAIVNLLGEILREPAFDLDQFGIVTKQRITRLENQLSDPQALGFSALTRAANPWPSESVHYVPTLQEQIDGLRAVTLDGVKELYESFYGADHAEIAIVGDFDEEALTAALESALGGWKSPAPYTRIPKQYRKNEAVHEAIDTPDKQMSIVGMACTLDIRDDDPDYPALDFATYVLGQSAKSRLMNRLRHEGGLSYGAAGFLRADPIRTHTFLMSYAICAPQNIDKALDAMREEIVKWVADGLTEEEIEEGRKSYALQFDNSLANDQIVVGLLMADLEVGRLFAFHADQIEVIKSLSKPDIDATMNKHFGKLDFIEIKAGDLSKMGDSE